jgi:hypothetical protein
VFSELQSHYLFADRFGRLGKGNDKGKVEGLVGWIRRNLLVPVSRDRLRGHDETIGERLARDLAAFEELPGAPYDACEKKAGRVSSLSLVCQCRLNFPHLCRSKIPQFVDQAAG